MRRSIAASHPASSQHPADFAVKFCRPRHVIDFNHLLLTFCGLRTKIEPTAPAAGDLSQVYPTLARTTQECLNTTSGVGYSGLSTVIPRLLCHVLLAASTIKSRWGKTNRNPKKCINAKAAMPSPKQAAIFSCVMQMTATTGV